MMWNLKLQSAERGLNAVPGPNGLSLALPTSVSILLDKLTKSLKDSAQKRAVLFTVSRYLEVQQKDNKFKSGKYVLEHNLEAALVAKSLYTKMKKKIPTEVLLALVLHNIKNRTTAEKILREAYELDFKEYELAQSKHLKGEKYSAAFDLFKTRNLYLLDRKLQDQELALLDYVKDWEMFAQMIYRKHPENIDLFAMLLSDTIAGANLSAQDTPRREKIGVYYPFFSFLAKFLNFKFKVTSKAFSEIGLMLDNIHINEIDKSRASLFKTQFKETYSLEYSKLGNITKQFSKKIKMILDNYGHEIGLNKETIKQLRIIARDKTIPSLLTKLIEVGSLDKVYDYLGFAVIFPEEILKSDISKIDMCHQIESLIDRHLTSSDQEMFLEKRPAKRKDRLAEEKFNQKHKFKSLMLSYDLAIESKSRKDLKVIPIEIQIMSEAMFDYNEFGDGAHIVYKGAEIYPQGTNFVLLKGSDKNIHILPISEKSTPYDVLLKVFPQTTLMTLASSKFKFKNVKMDENIKLISTTDRSWDKKFENGELFELTISLTGNYASKEITRRLVSTSLKIAKTVQQIEIPKAIENKNLESRRNLENKRKLIRRLNKNRKP